MCLSPPPLAPVPEETARIARAAFPKGNPYLTLRDHLGGLFTDAQFADLFPATGQPAYAPWRLALVCLLQFAENLTDRQAADQVRRSIDWKYLLGLELTDPGFHYSVLAEFRARLLRGGAASRLFDLLLEVCAERQLLRRGGQQRTDATHVLAAVRQLNRLELVGETLRHALNALADAAPAWLRPLCCPEWEQRYGRAFSEWRLPQSAAAREALARTIGADGEALLAALARPDTPPALRELPACRTLAQVWAEQYTADPPPAPPPTPAPAVVPATEPVREASAPAPTEAGAAGAAGAARAAGVAAETSGAGEGAEGAEGAEVGVPVGFAGPAPRRFRQDGELPPKGECCRSPYDPEARFGKKRSTEWTGYLVHLTESCDPDLPLLITHVHTTPAGQPEAAALPEIQAGLAARDLLPGTQLVDAAYVTGENLQQSQAVHQVELVGPDQGDTSWQAQAQAGFAAANFGVDWERQRVTCPGGKESVGWRERKEGGRSVIKVHFHRQDCTPCPLRAQCTRAREAGRQLSLPARPVWEALQASRAREGTPEFQAARAKRAGIEGTHSQATRRSGLRECRYVGQAKVHLQHLLTAAALNLVRLLEWVREPPRAHRRRSAFVRLLAT